jgi:hypothetical protein
MSTLDGTRFEWVKYARDESYDSKRIKGYIECSYNKEATQTAQAAEQSISFILKIDVLLDTRDIRHYWGSCYGSRYKQATDD